MNTGEYSANYYRRREAQEREMADKSQSDAIRPIHLALTDNYKAVAEKAESEGKNKPASPPLGSST